MTSDYRLLYGEINTNAAGTKRAHSLRGELPVISANATETLNAAGRMSATCRLIEDRPAYPNPHTRTTLAPAGTTVYLERNHEIVWGGILWACEADIGAMTLQLECEGFYSYFKNKTHPRYFIPALHDGVDTFDYIRDWTGMWFLTQSSGGESNLGIDKDTTDLGIVIPAGYRFSYLDRMTYGEIMEDIAEKVGGFDWRYRVYRDPADVTEADRIHVMLDLIPPGGVSTNHVWEVGTNCSMLRYREDGTSVINLIDAMGKGGIPVSGQNTDTYGTTYPALDMFLDLSDVDNASQLAALARQALIRGRGPMQHVVLSTFPDTYPLIGTYVVGDIVRIRSNVGWATMDETFRIVEISTNVADGGEEIQVTCTGITNFNNSAGITVVDFQ